MNGIKVHEVVGVGEAEGSHVIKTLVPVKSSKVGLMG